MHSCPSYDSGLMLLTISTTHAPATDLGFLLHKNPARPQSVDLSFGRAHVFYPEASSDYCVAALLLDVDPVGLVRNRRGPAGEGFSLGQYVNDRPYVASSFLSVAIAQVFGSALGDTSRERPELATTAIPLVAKISVLPCRGGEALLRKLFEPLGYSVWAARHPLDEKFQEWGEGPYYTVELSGTVTLQNLLAHLYVLIPVLDNDKHYWIGDDEVEKLLRHGGTWLANHPEKEQIVTRYLKHRKHLAKAALAQLMEEDAEELSENEERQISEEEQVEKKISLNEQRLDAVIAELLRSGATTVLGPSGAGKSSFARKHFKPTEILSSDFCRGLVCDDENSQEATGDAFDILKQIAGKRLARGLLTVIDATNVQPESRKPLVALAREHDVLPTAIVLNLSEDICNARNQSSAAKRCRSPTAWRRRSRSLRPSRLNFFSALNTSLTGWSVITFWIMAGSSSRMRA
jgi:predicted kinase